MKRIEAIALLAACVPLADWLAAQGVNIELTSAEVAALAGYRRVLNYDEGWWLGEPDIHRVVELQRSDIATLTYMAAILTQAEMRQQYATGEPLD